MGISSGSGSGSFLFDVARGMIKGHRYYTIPGRHEANVETNQLGDLSLVDSVVVLADPGGIQLEVVSSDAADTSAGTGARTVEVHYLDSSGDEQSETVTMNGTTAVNTVTTDIDVVQWLHAKTVGSGTVAAGNIDIRTVGGGGTDYCRIGIGGNQSLSAYYTIPNAHTGYIVGWQGAGLKKRIDFYLRATVERFDRSITSGVYLFQDVVSAEATTFAWRPLPFHKVPAGGKVKISVKADAVGGVATGSFDVLVVAD